MVDDEPFLRDAVAASLRFLGFEVTTAETGAGARWLARDRPFDLVVLDVMLPDTNGFDVVRRLRADGCRVPVIFLTARDTQADKVTGLTLGGSAGTAHHPDTAHIRRALPCPAPPVASTTASPNADTGTS